MAGVVRRGHFAFGSGYHGDTWLDLDALVADAAGLRDLCARLAQQLAGYQPDVVCGPLDGGAFVASHVAAALGARCVYANPDDDYALRPASDLSGRSAVVVDDAINAGAAVTGTTAALRRAAATVVGIGALIECTPGAGRVGPALGVPQHGVLSIPTQLWQGAGSPRCAAGVSVDQS